MREAVRISESSSQRIHFEALIKEIEDKVDVFTNSFLDLTKKLS